MDTLNCQRCIVSYNCEKIKNPAFGQKHCVDWSEPVKKCSDIQFKKNPPIRGFLVLI